MSNKWTETFIDGMRYIVNVETNETIAYPSRDKINEIDAYQIKTEMAMKDDLISAIQTILWMYESVGDDEKLYDSLIVLSRKKLDAIKSILKSIENFNNNKVQVWRWR